MSTDVFQKTVNIIKYNKDSYPLPILSETRFSYFQDRTENKNFTTNFFVLCNIIFHLAEGR